MKYILLSCILVMLLSCEQPVQEIPAVQESITAPEITIEETMERTITMNPIPDALGYLFKNGLLKGIDAKTDRSNFLNIGLSADIDGKSCGVVLNDFFTIDGVKYFSFTDRYTEDETPVEKELFYQQTGQTVTDINALPEKPVQPVMIIGAFDPFLFLKYTWENVEYNKLIFSESGAIISTAKGFDSAILTDNGILFSQPETLSRISGLWYMGNTQNGGPTRIGDYQIIY